MQHLELVVQCWRCSPAHSTVTAEAWYVGCSAVNASHAAGAAVAHVRAAARAWHCVGASVLWCAVLCAQLPASLRQSCRSGLRSGARAWCCSDMCIIVADR